MSGVLDQVRAELFGSDDRAWAGSVADLLFDGESIRREVPVGDNRVVVTSHRLLAFTPSADGENYRQADLPNVAGVRAGHVGETHLLAHAVRLLVFGGALLAVGLLFDFGSFVPTDAFSGTASSAGQLGIGGLLGTMQTMLSLLARLDDFAMLGGAALLFFGAFVVTVYLFTRDRVLEVSVAGDAADITVPAGDDAQAGAIDDAAAALEAELFAAEADEGNGGGVMGDAGAADAGFKPDDPL